jgi:multidrug efflux pump
MMCSRILRHTPKEQQGRFFKASERVFENVIAFYGRTLKFVLGYQTITLLVAAATLVLTIVLYIVIPKGFFPTQDTGVIQGISQAPETISFAAMEDKQQQLAAIILQDPAVESLSSFIGADGTNTTLNSGRMSINLKPLNVRNISASDVIRRLQTSLEPVEGIVLYMDPVQNITVDDRVSRTQYQYTLEDPDCERAEFVDRSACGQDEASASTCRCGHRPANRRLGGIAGDRSHHRIKARHCAVHH